jgi:hypothetical protein
MMMRLELWQNIRGGSLFLSPGTQSNLADKFNSLCLLSAASSSATEFQVRHYNMDGARWSLFAA